MYYKTTIPFKLTNSDGFMTEQGPKVELQLPEGGSITINKQFFQANFSYVGESLHEANSLVKPQPRAEEDGQAEGKSHAGDASFAETVATEGNGAGPATDSAGTGATSEETTSPADTTDPN